MGIYVKDGTPINGANLCESCSRAFIAQGYGETELVTICQALWPERRVHFPVRACTAYIEKNKPSYKEMEAMAIVLDRVSLKRDAGFIRVDETENGVENIELILDESRK